MTTINRVTITIKAETPYGTVNKVLQNPIPERMQSAENLQEFLRLCFSTLRFAAIQDLKERIKENTVK